MTKELTDTAWLHAAILDIAIASNKCRYNSDALHRTVEKRNVVAPSIVAPLTGDDTEDVGVQIDKLDDLIDTITTIAESLAQYDIELTESGDEAIAEAEKARKLRKEHAKIRTKRREERARKVGRKAQVRINPKGASSSYE